MRRTDSRSTETTVPVMMKERGMAMGKFDRRSRDQKRKAKLKKRSERSPKHESLAYNGSKFRSDAYVGVLFRSEIGIYETFVICDRELTDDTVEAAIER